MFCQPCDKSRRRLTQFWLRARDPLPAGGPGADSVGTWRCHMTRLRLGLILFVVAGCNEDQPLPAAFSDLSMAASSDQARPAVPDLLAPLDEAQSEPDL